uniref:Uncharacterized protein n=1 Tax=Anguilla anguilla TaxID=7936 RepID=A0A0E9XIZ1_ANGAN
MRGKKQPKKNKGSPKNQDK